MSEIKPARPNPNQPSDIYHFSSVPLPDDALEAVLEPLNGLLTLDLVGRSDVGLRTAALGNTLTRTSPITCQFHLKFIPDMANTHMQQKKSIP